MTNEQQEVVLAAVQLASQKWQNAFNAADAAGCASAYEQNAVMNVKSFGTFTGRAEIESFWMKIIADGFADVEYIDTKIEVLDEKTALLSSKWKMNNAHGVITKELWVIQSDGLALLREDDFEVANA